MRRVRLLTCLSLLFLSCTSLASAELLALLNYESKPNQPARREGIAIMEIDPESPDFGKILMDIPLPPDLVAHHIFFNRDRTKAYITALNKSVLHTIDLTRFPYRLRAIDVPECQMLEDLVVSEDNRTWFLTCMGSSTVIMGDAATDRPAKVVRSGDGAPVSVRYPHGIAIHNGINRVLITSTVKPDMSEAGDSVTVIEANTGAVLSTHRVSSKPAPSKSAPVEVMFSPNTTPPVVHITNMMEGTLWAGVWDPTTSSFSFTRSTTSARDNRACRWKCCTTPRATACSSPRRSRALLMCMTTAIRAIRSSCRPFPPPTARTIPCCHPMNIICSCRTACSTSRA